MPGKVCEWVDNDATTLVHSKKAIEAAMFITFITYTIATIISEIKRGTDVSLLYLNTISFLRLIY